MEREIQPEATVSPYARFGEQWHEVFADDDLRARFDELVDRTLTAVDTDTYPWAADKQDVAMRWQHLVEMLGDSAQTHSHPLFSNGRGWSDEVRVAEVLGPVEYRSFSAPFIENALLLTHSLAIQQGLIDGAGLAVPLNTLNNMRSNQDPKLVAYFTNQFDLRDMTEPTETVIGDMTLEDFKALSKEERTSLFDQINALVFDVKDHGMHRGWQFTPQKDKYDREGYQLQDFAKLELYGTTNSSEISQILDDRKAVEITQLRSERPDFGKLPEDYETLDKVVQARIREVFQYLDEMRERYETADIDTYSMGRAGFTEEDVEVLKAAGVLVDEKYSIVSGGAMYSYKLSTPYYECWVSRHYPVPNDKNN